MFSKINSKQQNTTINLTNLFAYISKFNNNNIYILCKKNHMP